MDEDQQRVSRKRKLWKWGGAVIIVAGIILAANAAVRYMLTAEFLEARFAAALSSATDSLYRITIGDVRYNVATNRFIATDVKLYPDSAILADTSRATAPEGLYSVTAPMVLISGTRLLPLLKGELRAGTLRLARPHLHLALDSRRAREVDTSLFVGPSAEYASRSDSLASFHLRLSRQLPRITVSLVTIDSATFSWERSTSQRDRRDSVKDISVSLSDVDTDSASATDTSRVLFSRTLTFKTGGYTSLTKDGIYSMSVDSVAGSTRDGSLRVSALNFAPVISDAELSSKLTTQTSRYRVSAALLEMSGIDFKGVLDDASVAVRSMAVTEPVLDVYLDRAIPKRGARPRASLPHEGLQQISWDIKLDSIEMRNGRLVYAEKAADGARAGKIRFEEFNGVLTNISNITPELTVPTREEGAVPDSRAVLKMQSRINDAGRMSARLEYDMARRGLNLKYSGSMSSMDAMTFNEILEDLEGVKVDGGRIDTVWFDVDVVNGRARGKVHIAYHDLNVGFQNKDTGKRGLFDVIKSFIANVVKVKADNPRTANEPAFTADVDITRAPDVALFGFLWVGLRQGLMSTLGI